MQGSLEDVAPGSAALSQRQLDIGKKSLDFAVPAAEPCELVQ